LFIFLVFFGKVEQAGVQNSIPHLDQERKFLLCSPGPQGLAGAMRDVADRIFAVHSFTSGKASC
jgi:hypothetical protein